jgi:threonine synthase
MMREGTVGRQALWHPHGRKAGSDARLSHLPAAGRGRPNPGDALNLGRSRLPGVGPEHAGLKDTGRATYTMVTDSQALEAMQMLSRTEGIISAFEPSHAIYHGMQLAKTMKKDEIVLINCCGRGDKDMITVAKALGHNIDLSKEGLHRGRCLASAHRFLLPKDWHGLTPRALA